MRRAATLICDYAFEASHILRRDDWSAAENERVFGDCARLHGHSYLLRLHLRGEVSPEDGMVLNFRDVKAIVERDVLAHLDHRHLNDVLSELTTAENLCHWIGRALLPALGDVLARVELWETRTNAAILTEEDVALLRASLPRATLA